MPPTNQKTEGAVPRSAKASEIFAGGRRPGIKKLTRSAEKWARRASATRSLAVLSLS